MRGQSILVICFGSVLTLCMYGYQFGQGNHASYLVDPLRRSNPALLANDWFATQTLQYHIVFSRMTELLMRLRIVEPAFFILYLALVVLFHIAWRNMVSSVGGGDAAYLVSLVLYYLSAAGTGLGMYQFFQDSSLLASNIANVALLWGICLWLRGSPVRAGMCLGIAGIFHLNHAIVGSAMWVLLRFSPSVATATEGRGEGSSSNSETRPASQQSPHPNPLPDYRERGLRSRGLWLGTIAALLPSAVNLAFAAHLKLARSGAMPLKEFVDLYVHLRHPHHYAPSTWPIGIWMAFLWPVAAGLLLLGGQARRIFLILLAFISIGLIAAGVWYTSETLIQMSLYRFSIYVQLLGCSAGGAWITGTLNRKRLLVGLSAGVSIAMIVICAIRGPFFGFFKMPQDDADYVALCRWIEKNTPSDAVFLVPPSEESMHLVGQRAVVVNFKCVPQLSAELVQWRQRLCDALGLSTLNDLPRGYAQTLGALSYRYDRLGPDQLLEAAHKYRADYIVAMHPLAGWEDRRIVTDASGRYLLYHAPRQAN